MLTDCLGNEIEIGDYCLYYENNIHSTVSLKNSFYLCVGNNRFYNSHTLKFRDFRGYSASASLLKLLDKEKYPGYFETLKSFRSVVEAENRYIANCDDFLKNVGSVALIKNSRFEQYVVNLGKFPVCYDSFLYHKTSRSKTPFICLLFIAPNTAGFKKMPHLYGMYNKICTSIEHSQNLALDVTELSGAGGNIETATNVKVDNFKIPMYVQFVAKLNQLLNNGGEKIDLELLPFNFNVSKSGYTMFYYYRDKHYSKKDKMAI